MIYADPSIEFMKEKANVETEKHFHELLLIESNVIELFCVYVSGECCAYHILY